MTRSRLGRLARWVPAVVLALVARDAHAWDSICYQYADPTQPVALLGAPSTRGCEAIDAARGRWRDPVHWLDEHRIVLRQAMLQGGLPRALLETIVLGVPTSGFTIDAGHDHYVPVLRPLPLDDRTDLAKLETRAFALDELAQLPDFSYSLYDWAGGNERCPVAALAAEGPPLGATIACHQFKTHMGALNSNHFPPQSDRWYRWLHDLALQRADQCKATRTAAWTSFGDATAAGAFDSRWYPIWRECEVEALAIEAVAQHYLQDSWSSGHMWQRWGSTELDRFPPTMSTDPGVDGHTWNLASDNKRRLMTGELVALFAGTIHGSDGPQYEASLSNFFIPAMFNDPACYPTSSAIAYVAGASAVPAAGDMHLHDVLGDPWANDLYGQTAEQLHTHYASMLFPNSHTPSAELEAQRDALFGCATASVRAVYDRLANPATFGAPTYGAATGPAPAPPAAGCDAPRLSARAWSQSIDGETMAYVKYNVATSQGATLSPVPSDISGRAFAAYDRARKIATLIAQREPTSTDVANLNWAPFEYDELVCTAQGPQHECLTWTSFHRSEPGGAFPFLGVGRNSDYLAPANDPPGAFADPALPWGNPAQPQALVAGSPEQLLASTFHRAHAPLWCARTDLAELNALEAATLSAPAATKPGLCGVCTEVLARHVRPAPGGKSLCDVLSPGSAVLADTGNALQVAQRHCGCSDQFAAITDAGLTFFKPDQNGAMTTVGGPVPAGAGVTDATTASRNRIFVSNGAGQLVGFRWSGFAMPTAVELDLTPADPLTTRYPIGGEPRGLAAVEALGKDWLLVVDAASDQLKVFDLGAANAETFTPCRTVDVGRDPARIEGPWDLVIKADGSKAFVSLRGPVATPGDAIAMVDVAALVNCAGPAPVVTHVTTFGNGRGLGAMAFSPDQQYLAVAARRRTPCLDQTWTTAFGMVTQDVQVPCDEIYVLRVAQLVAGPLGPMAPVVFGARDSLPTRPVMYPYAVTWRPDGSELAYGSLLGFTPWPSYHDLNAQGAVALGVMGAASFPAGAGNQQHWSYNAALAGTVRGENLEFTADGTYLLVGSSDGKLTSLPAAPAHDFWQHRDGDPETGLHQNANMLNRSWYGGCRATDASCFGGFCPAYCPTGAADAVHTLTLGSPVRKLLRL